VALHYAEEKPDELLAALDEQAVLCVDALQARCRGLTRWRSLRAAECVTGVDCAKNGP